MDALRGSRARSVTLFPSARKRDDDAFAVIGGLVKKPQGVDGNPPEHLRRCLEAQPLSIAMQRDPHTSITRNKVMLAIEPSRTVRHPLSLRTTALGLAAESPMIASGSLRSVSRNDINMRSEPAA
jgi:hypothetical protein